MKKRMLFISLLSVVTLACAIPFQALAQGGPPGGGGSANVELTAKRDAGNTSKGLAGKWIAKEGNNDVKLEIKVEGSKLSGTIENTQFPGAIELKDGKVEGDNISFKYVRSISGQDFDIEWTGTLSGDELKLKRVVGGMPGGGR